MSLRVKLLVGVLVALLGYLIWSDWGKRGPYPLEHFPCQFPEVECIDSWIKE